MKTCLKRTVFTVLAAGFLSAIPSAVQAAMVHVDFDAQITYARNPVIYQDLSNGSAYFDALNPFGVAVGDTFSCWAEYDATDVPSGFTGTITGALYSITVGNQSFTETGDSNKGLLYFENGALAGLEPLHFYYKTFYKQAGGIYGDNEADFAARYDSLGNPIYGSFEITNLDATQIIIRGDYVNFQAPEPVVPVPAALPLLGSALAAFALARRRVS